MCVSMLYSVALCAQISRCCRVDREDYTCKAEVPCWTKPLCGSKSFILGGFKSPFCTGDGGREASVREQGESVVVEPRGGTDSISNVKLVLGDLKLEGGWSVDGAYLLVVLWLVGAV